MIIKHRSQQRLQGVITLEKERRCSACRVVFKSKRGLFNHQTRSKSSNPGCYRTGLNRRRSEWTKGHLLNNKNVSVKGSFFTKHTRGKPITKEEKTLCLNYYQSRLDKGRDHGHAVSKTAKIFGFSHRAISRIVKEKNKTGTVKDNNRKYRKSKTAFEKLSEEQVDR